MSEQRELKPGAKIYHREYGHGWVVPSYSPASDGRDVWAVIDGHEGRRRMRHRDRSTFWDLADSHGEHNVGRVAVVETDDPWHYRGGRGCYLVVSHGSFVGTHYYELENGDMLHGGTWGPGKLRWATPQEQAKYYEERGDEGHRAGVDLPPQSAPRPDPHLADRDMLCESGCGVVPHRYRPSVEAGPYWRCSECGETTGSAHEMEPEHGPHRVGQCVGTKALGTWVLLSWDDRTRSYQASRVDGLGEGVFTPDRPIWRPGDWWWLDDTPTETPAPHADCLGCGGDPAKHGHYTACMTMNMADQDEPSAKYAADLAAAEDEARARALYNLRVEYAALGRGPYPESCLDGADARSVLWGDHGKR